MVSIESADPFNVDLVLQEYTDLPISKFAAKDVPKSADDKGGKPFWDSKKGSLVVVFDDESKIDIDWYKIGKFAQEHEVTLVLVNPLNPSSVFTNIGSVEVPDAAVHKVFDGRIGADRVTECLPALRGLSLKAMSEVMRLSTASYKEVSPRAIQSTRKKYFPAIDGLTPVNDLGDFYFPEQSVLDWVKLNLGLLAGDVPPILRPRGLLMNGQAGTGKTSGGKYIADKMGLPCYLMSMPNILDKWIGSSGRNMSAVLKRVEMLSPCVIIFDEVEKLFGGTLQHETHKGLLAQLLWWLQEHEFPILSIMTTNKQSSIPPELFRPGRIDATITLKPLQGFPRIKDFAKQYAEFVKKEMKSTMDIGVDELLSEVLQHVTGDEYTPAEIKQFVITEVKKLYVKMKINV